MKNVFPESNDDCWCGESTWYDAMYYQKYFFLSPNQ